MSTKKIIKTTTLENGIVVNFHSIPFQSKLDFFTQSIIPLLTGENIDKLLNLEVGQGNQAELLKSSLELLSTLGNGDLLNKVTKLILINNTQFIIKGETIYLTSLEDDIITEIEPDIIIIIKDGFIANFQPLFERFFSQKK